MDQSRELQHVKEQKWFYEFVLPDGTTTESYLAPAARAIHATREKVLRRYLNDRQDLRSTALDVACHEGFFSMVLADYFTSVTAFDKNTDSIVKARQITSLLGRPDITFKDSSVEAWDPGAGADFVLCFGLLYHVENPVAIIRKLATLAGKAICIESQVLPFNVTGAIEDGAHNWQRSLRGTFGLCADYSHSPEGGTTDFALVPSREALRFLLTSFGFADIQFYTPERGDYEQYVRGHRVIVFATRDASQ
ncbi:MAG TPA: methyltransferase domain-containing protein [Vicinamibacterales bacterium]|nr:methyltransferase domain-containing protein [Vicinamibacterales bacterium]